MRMWLPLAVAALATGAEQPIPYSHRTHLQLRKLAAFAQSGEAVPWERVYNVAAGIYWNHRTHLDAGAKCERCHGDVAKMDVMTEVTNVATMAGCVACHRETKTSTGCNLCHEER
jgi:hypothetical protein